jgi:phenylacetic acid degradation protein
MPIYQFEKKIPKISKSTYVHPQAVIIGDVTIGDRCFIGAGAVLRGDFGRIEIGKGTSIQENVVLHVGVNEPVTIYDYVIIAHGAILHGVTVKSYVLVGMNSVLMNRAFCEEHVLIASASLVKEKFHIPPNMLVAGNPAKIIKPLSREQRRAIHQGVKDYQSLVKQYKKTCFEVNSPRYYNKGEER